MQDLCRTQAEEIIIGTLIVRQLITSGRYSEVSDTTINILTKMGYDPWNPTAISLWTPKSLDDVRHIDKSLRAASPTDEEVAPLITSLLSFAGYVFNASGRADYHLRDGPRAASSSLHFSHIAGRFGSENLRRNALPAIMLCPDNFEYRHQRGIECHRQKTCTWTLVFALVCCYPWVHGRAGICA